jgi:hypothetical protein
MIGGTSENTTYTAGEIVTVTASEDATKVFSGWTATGIELDAESAGKTSITFVMPANDVTLTAIFVDKTYEVHLPEGAVFADGAQEGRFVPGDTVQILWNDPEKHLVSWSFSQKVEGNVTDNPMTFTMPAVDLVVGADSFDKTRVIALEMEEPIPGETLPIIAVYHVNGAAFNANVTWYDGETAITTAESGKTYLAVISIAESVTDGIVFAESGTATVNGNIAESWTLIDKGVAVSVSVDIAENNVLPGITASVIGNGSWIAIAVLTFGFAACVVITIVIHNKRKGAPVPTKGKFIKK